MFDTDTGLLVWTTLVVLPVVLIVSVVVGLVSRRRKR